MHESSWEGFDGVVVDKGSPMPLTGVTSGEVMHGTARQRPVRVLVLDVRPTVQLGTITTLKSRWPAWEVLGVDVEEVAGLVEHSWFDLVVTDLHLHDKMQGLKVCEIAKDASPTASTLVFVEDHDPEALVSTMTSQVVDGMIQRTACLSTFTHVVESVLQGFQSVYLDAPPAATEISGMGEDDALSPRERSILALLLRRWTNREIATYLHLAEQTVKNNLSSIYGKLGMRGRTDIYERMLPRSTGNTKTLRKEVCA